MTTSNAFFQGTLHEAIAFSMQNNMHFAALIIDDSEATPENKIWEDEYLQDKGLAKLFKEQTILYRIVAGSPEAMNLYAFVPMPEKLPCLVIIKSGTAQVESIGVVDGNKTLEDVSEWVKKVLEGTQELPTALNPAAAPSSAPVVQDPTRETPLPTVASQQEAPPTNITQVYDPPASESIESTGAKDKGKAKDTTSGSSSSLKTTHPTQVEKNSNLEFIAEQRKRAQEAEVERQRVKRLLEEDKAMRAAKEREAREARERERAGTTPAQSVRSTRPNRESKECALSFRLLDGSALKHKFPADVKLGVEVRKWIDQNRPDETDRPYTFTQLLTPFPNKHISLSEENSTLKSLGLTPSATLVLTPSNTTQASAYPSLGGIPSPWGLVSALTSGVSSVLGTGYNAVTGAVSAVTGGSGNHQPPPETSTDTPPFRQGVGSPRPSRGNGGTRIRTIHDASGQAGEGRNVGNKFYNGNQLNFEPNQDGRDGR